MISRLRAAAAIAAAGVLLLAGAASPTTSAWTDPAVFTAQASAGTWQEPCVPGQDPVTVTTTNPAPATSVRVDGIDPACLGESIAVQLAENVTQPAPIHTQGFESTSLGGWGARGASFARTNAGSPPPRTGSWAAAVTNRTQAWHGAQVDLTSQVPIGSTHEFSAWVRLPAGTTGAPQFVATIQHGASSYANNYDLAVTATTTQWVRVAFTWTRPTGSDRVIFIIETRGDAGSNPNAAFRMDDAQVVRVITPQSTTGTGTVTGPSTVVSPMSPSFTPVANMAATVEIGGVAVPATWVYGPPAPTTGCTVVYAGTANPVPGRTCQGSTVTQSGGYGAPGSRVRQFNIGFTAPGIATDNSEEILFTTNLSDAPGVPSGWSWTTSTVLHSSLIPHPGYSCDSLPSFTARAPGWAASSPAYFELLEQAGPGGSC